jgi:hypothetical protein
MNKIAQRTAGFIAGATLLIGMPLLGVWLTGLPLAPYLEMPPRTNFVTQAAFSWPGFWGLAASIVLVVGPFMWRVISVNRHHRSNIPSTNRHPFPWWGWLALMLAAGGLAGISLWPELLFPLLWISPLIIIGSIQALNGTHTLLNEPGRGNWQPLFLAAISALLCGFFWEMWNFYSLEKWVYTVPFVDRFHLFEMPVLGFAGYLPFGIECALIAEFLGTKQTTDR